MAHVTIIIVVLKLQDKTVPDKIQFGRKVVTEMTGNANFPDPPGPDPTLDEVSTATDELETAFNNQESGGPTETAITHEKETEFDRLLTRLGNYVEGIANEDPETAKSVALSSGMEVKAESVPVGQLAKAVITKLEPTENIGEFKVDWGTVKNARNYDLRAYTDGADPSGSIVFDDTFSPSKATVEGLPSGEKVFVQVRANGGSTGHGPGSDAAWARPR